MDENARIVEALIFASDTPLPARKIKELLDSGTEGQIKKIIEQINSFYDKNTTALQIVEVAGGFQLVTRPEMADWVTQLYRSRSAGRLTRRALETLAIIAYKQPVTKQEMEHIRGVNVDGVVKTLIERNLITVTGRQKAPGNPLLYGTTKYFLEYFGLNDIKDLPKLKEIDELLKGDDKFLESLDQISLHEMLPEELGLTSMLSKKSEQQPADPEAPAQSESEEKKDSGEPAETQEDASSENKRESGDATE